MKFREFILQMNSEELQNYAKNAGTTVGYLKTHLLYGYKEPRKTLRKALVTASKGQVSEAEMLQHFGLYPQNLSNNLKDNNLLI